MEIKVNLNKDSRKKINILKIKRWKVHFWNRYLGKSSNLNIKWHKINF